MPNCSPLSYKSYNFFANNPTMTITKKKKIISYITHRSQVGLHNLSEMMSTLFTDVLTTIKRYTNQLHITHL